MAQERTLDKACREALAMRDSGQPAIEFDGDWIKWREVCRLAEKLEAFINQSGAGRHPTVAFVARNRPSALAAFLGLLARGCTVRMLYPFQSAAAIAREIARIEPNLVIAAGEDLRGEILRPLERNGIAAAALSEMDIRPLPGLEVSRTPSSKVEKKQVILLTSGTTGTPKEFPLDYGMVLKYFADIGVTPGLEVDKQSATPALVYFPVSNLSGLYSTLSPLLNGLPLVLLDRFSLEGWRSFVVRYRPGEFGIPPVGIKMILDAAIPPEDLASIKSLGVGAAPLDINLQQAFERRYGIPVLPAYGATEFAGPVAAMTLDLWQQWGQQKMGSVGRALPGMRLRVVDSDTGVEMPRGNTGILEVVCNRIGTDWIRTSDLALIDDDDFLFLQGRADGAIIRGGFKILPKSIEQGLLANPTIADAAVVAIADERLGEIPAAAIVLKEGQRQPALEEIEKELRRCIPATHIPGKWRIVASIPRTFSLKVDIPAVRRLLGEG